MVKFLLEIFATMKNVKSLRPNKGVDNIDMGYFFKMRCEACGDITGEQCAYIRETVVLNNKLYNLTLKCKNCSRVGTVTLVPGFGTAFTYYHAERDVWAPLMMFDCEGLTPEVYIFNGGWIVENFSEKIGGANLKMGKFEGTADTFGHEIPVIKNAKGRFVRQ